MIWLLIARRQNYSFSLIHLSFLISNLLLLLESPLTIGSGGSSRGSSSPGMKNILLINYIVFVIIFFKYQLWLKIDNNTGFTKKSKYFSRNQFGVCKSRDVAKFSLFSCKYFFFKFTSWSILLPILFSHFPFDNLFWRNKTEHRRWSQDLQFLSTIKCKTVEGKL